MIESLIPKEYLPYFEYLPDVHKVANVAISLTPLYTYGTACWGIYRKKLSVGFSIDICATMIMASVLRILYYFISPYEKSLLRQLFVMVIVQCVLLKVLLQYRPASYNPDTLAELPDISEKWAQLPKLSSSQYNYNSSNFYKFSGELAYQYFLIFAGHIIRLFDVYYRRPGTFWQWIDEYRYWRFILTFTTVFAVLTIMFRQSSVYASFIGILGLFIEALLPLPQILMLQRLKTVENFKVILLVSWLGGDCLKLSYLFFGTDDVSSIFILAGLFQMALDLVILAQYVHFRTIDEKKSNSNGSELPMFEMSSLSSSN